MMSPIPLWTEVAFAAIEDFTHGTAVVDGVMLGIGLEGQVKEPIRWTLEGGKCVNIEGGAEAEKLRQAIEGVENATVIGEFAFGTSEKAPFGTPSEKGRIGTVHLALGDNHNAYPGGQNHLLAAPRRRLPERDPADRRRRHLHREGRGVGAVTTVRLEEVDPIELPQGSWSRMLVTDAHVDGNTLVARLLGLHPGHRAVASEARDRGGRLRRLRLAARSGSTTAPCRSRRAMRCTSRPASGMRSRTPATRTSSWCSASRTPPTRRPRGADGCAVSRQSLEGAARVGVPHPAAEGYADLTLGHISARGPEGESGSSGRASRSTRSNPTTSSRSTTPTRSSTSRPCCTPAYTGREKTSAQSSTGIPLRDRPRCDHSRSRAPHPRRHPVRRGRRPVSTTQI